MTTSQTRLHALRVATDLQRRGAHVIHIAIINQRPTIAIDGGHIPAGLRGHVYRSGPLHRGRYRCHTATISGCQARWMTTHRSRAA